MKKLIALGIVVILLAGLTGTVMARCVIVNPKTIDLTSNETFKVTIENESIEVDGKSISIAENANSSTVVCEGASVVKSQLTGNDKKLMLWFNITDLVGVYPGEEVELTISVSLYDGTSFDQECDHSIRVISGEEE